MQKVTTQHTYAEAVEACENARDAYLTAGALPLPTRRAAYDRWQQAIQNRKAAADAEGERNVAPLYAAMARAYAQRAAEARREACVTGNWERVARLEAQAERARQLAAQ